MLKAYLPAPFKAVSTTVLAATIAACGGTAKTSEQSISAEQHIGKLKSSQVTKLKGNEVVLWNGDNVISGGKWVSVTNKDIDTASLEIDRSEGVSGNTSLRFQVSGSDWMGFGWNWLDLWGQLDGQDISKYKTLSFQVKLTGAKLPPANNISVQLASGGQPGGRAIALPIATLTTSDFTDGQWHKIEAPLASFDGTNIPNMGPMDLKLAREFSIGVNSSDYVDFDIFIDDIKLLK